MTASSPDPDVSWQDLGACKGMDSELFFGPEQGEAQNDRYVREQAAKAVCKDCRVREKCLEYSLMSRQRYGIWGGLTEAERKLLLRRAG